MIAKVDIPRILYADTSVSRYRLLRRWARDIASALGHNDLVWASRLMSLFPSHRYRDYL